AAMAPASVPVVMALNASAISLGSALGGGLGGLALTAGALPAQLPLLAAAVLALTIPLHLLVARSARRAGDAGSAEVRGTERERRGSRRRRESAAPLSAGITAPTGERGASLGGHHGADGRARRGDSVSRRTSRGGSCAMLCAFCGSRRRVAATCP